MTTTAERLDAERVVHHLAAIDRPSASPGERQAAEWIADRFAALGLDAAVEQESAHGGYWWPLGVLSAAAGLAGLSRRRRVAAAIAAAAALGIREELELRGRLWTRRLLPCRPTWNVVARAGDPAAERTVVLVAHHDAAHAGLVFWPPLARIAPIQRLMDRTNASPALMWLVFANPLAVLLGALLGRRGLQRWGAVNALVSALSFFDIGLRRTVPGANDNLSGVAAVLLVAQALVDRPVEGVRVLLVSTGSEESFEEGMRGFVDRHRPELDPSRTTLVAVDTVGSPHLVLLLGEGMLRPVPYDPDVRRLLLDAAVDAGVDLRDDHWLSFGSDALIALREGIPCALLGSVDESRLPSNYHWYSDTAENVDYGTVRDAAAVCEAAIRRLVPQATSARA